MEDSACSLTTTCARVTQVLSAQRCARSAGRCEAWAAVLGEPSLKRLAKQCSRARKCIQCFVKGILCELFWCCYIMSMCYRCLQLLSGRAGRAAHAPSEGCHGAMIAEVQLNCESENGAAPLGAWHKCWTRKFNCCIQFEVSSHFSSRHWGGRTTAPVPTID